MQYILFDGKTDIIENKGKNGKQVAGTTWFEGGTNMEHSLDSKAKQTHCKKYGQKCRCRYVIYVL
jgi:hypothetical protein